MKYQIILSLLFLIIGSFSVVAQNNQPERTVDQAVVVQQKNGEVVDYESLLRRFETAYKESDQESVNDLKAALLKRMSNRISDLEAVDSRTAQQQNQLDAQKLILKSTREYSFDFSAKDHAQDLKKIKDLQKFAELMKDNFSDNH